MHQHSTDQAVLFLIPLMERESEPVYLYFLYSFYMFSVLASVANLHMHAPLVQDLYFKSHNIIIQVFQSGGSMDSCKKIGHLQECTRNIRM